MKSGLRAAKAPSCHVERGLRPLPPVPPALQQTTDPLGILATYPEEDEPRCVEDVHELRPPRYSVHLSCRVQGAISGLPQC
eukprot:364007-Chlamydomonas_euryale.AAC.11